MATKPLIDRIEGLPADKRAQVEEFVEFLAGRDGAGTRAVVHTGTTFPDELLERIRLRRERLFREHGSFNTGPILRDLRENGPS